MKYLSLLIFVLAMYWTWSVVQHSPNVNEVVHIGIQDDLKKIITNYIEENLPTASDIRFEKFWTEAVKKDQVKAMFSYSFAESNEESQLARITIAGHAILNREPSQEDQVDLWSFDELYISDNKVAFEEGLTIKASGDE